MALDTISAPQPQLVQLKFTSVQANNHLVANRVKAGLAPFVFRPKATWEVPGAAAVVRLHDATPAIFFVMVYGADDAADPKAAMDGFAIVRLQPDEGKRVVGMSPSTSSRPRASAPKSRYRRKSRGSGSLAGTRSCPLRLCRLANTLLCGFPGNRPRWG